MRLRAVVLVLLVITGVSAAATIWYCFTRIEALTSTG